MIIISVELSSKNFSHAGSDHGLLDSAAETVKLLEIGENGYGNEARIV